MDKPGFIVGEVWGYSNEPPGFPRRTVIWVERPRDKFRQHLVVIPWDGVGGHPFAELLAAYMADQLNKAAPRRRWWNRGYVKFPVIIILGFVMWEFLYNAGVPRAESWLPTEQGWWGIVGVILAFVIGGMIEKWRT